MPFQRGVTGELLQLQLRGPGSFGLNTEAALAVTDHRWLTQARNIVYDETGRLTSRKGLNALTTSGAHSADTESIAEYIANATSSEIISAAGLAIYSGTTSLTDVTGTITTPTANDWQFLNFNGKLIGVQQGHAPVVYSGASFADITPATGTLPTGNCGSPAFGRLWIADSDKTTLKWCDVLDETDWGTGTAGSLDTLTVWPDGIDTISAVQEWQDRLLIFGTRSILVYTGAEDPSTMVLSDVINVGTKHRDSVVPVGNDLLFLSFDGLRAISRAIEYENLPTENLCPQISSKIRSQIENATVIKAAYSKKDAAYLCRIAPTGTAFYWYFDVSTRLPDGTLRAVEWAGINYTAIGVSSDETCYLGMNGKIAEHDGFDDDGASYTMQWLTAGFDGGVQGEKILKSVRILVAAENTFTMRVRWVLDFNSRTHSAQRTITLESGADEWNVAEWGIGEWSGSVRSLLSVSFPMSCSGQIVQVGASATVDGFEISMSNVQLLTKIGRLAA